MPRRVNLEEPTKRSRQRRGRRKESLRAKGHLSYSSESKPHGRGSLPGLDSVSGGDNLPLKSGRFKRQRQDGDRRGRDPENDYGRWSVS